MYPRIESGRNICYSNIRKYAMRGEGMGVDSIIKELRDSIGIVEL